MVTSEKEQSFDGPVYGCGGQYRQKPQIQCHTNKWWGHCPTEKLKEVTSKSLLEAEAVIWLVKEDGERFHIASFSDLTAAEDFARGYSKDYPNRWNTNVPVSHIELEGGWGNTYGYRYQKGNIIAVKKIPLTGEVRDPRWVSATERIRGYLTTHEIID